MNLHRLESAITRKERSKLNENFDRIEGSYKGVIDTSNEARDKSTIALKVANDINGKATEALEKSEDAIVTSNESKEIAEQAGNVADATAQQLDDILREPGMSDAEVVAMRTDRETGEIFPTAGNRLDAQHAAVKVELNGKTNKNEVIVYASYFGVIADLNLATMEGTDNTEALQNAFNHARNVGAKTLMLPPGRIKITQPLRITTANMKIKGEGFATEIVYDGLHYNSEVIVDDANDIRQGEAVLVVRQSSRNTSGIVNDSSIPRITIENVSFHGGDKTLYAVKVRSSSGIRFLGCRFRRSFGFIDVSGCPLLRLRDCVVEYNTTSKPTSVSQTDWDLVKNTGLVKLHECHVATLDNVFVYGAGHIESTALRSVFYIDSTVSVSFKDLVIERDARYLAGQQIADKPTVNHAFYLNTMVRNFKLDNIYFEHMDVLSLLTSVSAANTNIDIERAYINMSSFYYHPFYIEKGQGVSVKKVYAWGTFFATYHFVHTGDVALSPELNDFYWHAGKKGGVHNRKTLADGKQYADSEFIGDVGLSITNAQVVSDGHKIPRVTSGLTVTTGSDAIGKYIAIAAGNMINHEGRNVSIGVRLSDTVHIGWILRPNLQASRAYNVCADGFGGVWVELVANALPVTVGKVIIATFSTDANNNIVNFTSIINAHKGIYTNGAVNKLAYTTTLPTVGIWSKGDRAVNVTGTPGHASEWLCTAAGSPGTWQPINFINITGTGAPEGNVVGHIGAEYIDTVTGKVYKKISGTGNAGWKEVTVV